MNIDTRTAALRPVPPPAPVAAFPVELTDDTMAQRLQKILRGMKEEKLDALVVYGDVEHGANFEYLTGFVTRYEEGLLVLHADGDAVLIVGNENGKVAAHSRLPARVLRCPAFSLPNQPMDGEKPLQALLAEAGLRVGQRVGLAGWKLFTGIFDTASVFDAPAYVADALRSLVGATHLINATGLFIGRNGARRCNNANEIAHYEYGAALSSDCVLRTMNALRPGVTELELGSLMHAQGQRPTVVTICATGQRYQKANLYPTNRALRVGDPVSMTCGYKGGLASRAAYAVSDRDELPEDLRSYVDALALPYWKACAAWLESLRVGLRGGALFDRIEEVLPRRDFHWSLNPGHLTADEEWLCSPIHEGSSETLQSGMLLQMDIIPSIAGLGGVGCENGVALCDEALRAELRAAYPALWQRVQARRAYVSDALGLRLPEEVLPLCSGLGYFRPYLLDQQKAFSLR